MEELFPDVLKLIYGSERHKCGQEQMLPCANQVLLRTKALIPSAAGRDAYCWLTPECLPRNCPWPERVTLPKVMPFLQRHLTSNHLLMSEYKLWL